MNIYGLNKTTLLDYPTHVAATVFTGSCNFRCPFCHNKDLVLSSLLPLLSTEDVFSFLQKRKGILTGVCITGGEPTLQADLVEFCKQIKAIGYSLKLDTNGYRPAVLEALFNAQVLDYVAMDIKNSLANYPKTVGLSEFISTPIIESISLIRESGILYEFRTTVVQELHTKDSFLGIRDLLSTKDNYFLQSYEENENVISPGFHACTKEQLAEFVLLLKEKLPLASLRGVD